MGILLCHACVTLAFVGSIGKYIQKYEVQSESLELCSRMTAVLT